MSSTVLNTAGAIQNLDVTLRDGGYRNNFAFPLPYALAHVQASHKCGVEWIEIGYRNGSFNKSDGLGITGLCRDDYVAQIRETVPQARLCVIAHPHNIRDADVDDLARLGVGMLRICVTASNIKDAAPLIARAKSRGLVVCTNVTRASLIAPQDLQAMVMAAQDAGADVAYIADSNGSLQPDRVTSLVARIRDVAAIKVGFHAHDNLGLAMANSIAALKAGATYIDSSLFGLGKGIGNLKLESWLSYLNHNLDGGYDIGLALDQLCKLSTTLGMNVSRNNILDLILGYHDLTVEHHSVIAKRSMNVVNDFSVAKELREAL